MGSGFAGCLVVLHPVCRSSGIGPRPFRLLSNGKGVSSIFQSLILSTFASCFVTAYAFTVKVIVATKALPLTGVKATLSLSPSLCLCFNSLRSLAVNVGRSV